MTRPTLLLAAICCCLCTYAQKSDTLILFYKTGQYIISKTDQKKIDEFLTSGWDRISINGYTDETDEEGYNLELSKKRSKEVVDFLQNRKVVGNTVSYQFFGETMPFADNESEEGKALNRRTEVIGYRYPRIQPRPVVDPMIPVTRSLDNGFLVTYRPGSIPASVAASFDAGSGSVFQMITNTSEMRQNNVYNNTTNGEILSSVTIFCGYRLNPCKLDTPVLLRVPIPFETNCPIEKVKFFNTVAENGKRIWQEQSKELYPEIINGKKYVRVWIDNFCECINFDFKLDPECYPVDSAQVFLVNARLKNFTVELKEMNSVYIPKKKNDSSFSLVYLKGKSKNAVMSFSLYAGKKRIRSFRDQPLTSVRYDSVNHSYSISVDSIQIYFPKMDIADVALKVNKDKYRVAPEKSNYSFIYLNRPSETILVDFSLIDSKGNFVQFKDQPLTSLNYDAVRRRYVVDRQLVRMLKKQQSTTQLHNHKG
jgi:hypothetical protein